MRMFVLAATIVGVLSMALPAQADRYVLIAATKEGAWAADLDLRKDTADQHVLFQIEREMLFDARSRYTLMDIEADCAAGRMNVRTLRFMSSPRIEVRPPIAMIVEWQTPKPGSPEAMFLNAGCAPTFPKTAVIETGDGIQDYDHVLDSAIRGQLGLKPTDPLPKFRH